MAGEKTRTQIALEYLVTYGWALVLIATLVTVLVFVGTGNINVNTCTNFLQFICKGIGAEGDTLVLILQNGTGQKITINPFLDIRFDDKEGYAIVTYKGNDYRFEDVTIEAGEQFTISAKGMANSEQISITYIEKSTGLRKTVTSKIRTDAPEDLELSNDAIDNDGDGLTDCEETETTFCEYTVEATPGFNPNITTVGETIPFGPLTGTSGSTVDGDWKTQTVALVFYVESFTPGAKPRVSFAGETSSGEQNIVQGWNVVEVDITTPVEFTGDNMPDFVLQAQDTGMSFTINDTDKKPKAYLVVNTPEISYNGLDDDGDGLVDCNDPEATNCPYLNEAEPGFETLIEAGTGKTIQFGPLIGTSGNVVEGNWKMDQAMLSFNVESYEPGATASIFLDATMSPSWPVTSGWNVIAITLPSPMNFTGDDAPEFELWAQVGDFTINDTDDVPIATWIVNKA